MKLREKLLNRVIELARRTPYFHLYHGDGTLYMERYWVVPFASNKEGCFVAEWDRHPLHWLLQKLGIAVRLHCIHTPDLDRALHDHPWTFISTVLRGWYIEERPVRPEVAEFAKYLEHVTPPSYDGLFGKEPPLREVIDRLINPPLVEVEKEPTVSEARAVGSTAVRRFHHRHRISAVSPGGVWTLFITFRKRQSWGFFTPQGKVWWWIFESVHNNKPISGKP